MPSSADSSTVMSSSADSSTVMSTSADSSTLMSSSADSSTCNVIFIIINRFQCSRVSCSNITRSFQLNFSNAGDIFTDYVRQQIIFVQFIRGAAISGMDETGTPYSIKDASELVTPSAAAEISSDTDQTSTVHTTTEHIYLSSLSNISLATEMLSTIVLASSKISSVRQSSIVEIVSSSTDTQVTPDASLDVTFREPGVAFMDPS
ncbi:uncharacterized protein [Haliotis cracherodii]|uniref:uncharacterized protein n=1 Tax=Haliotis cracherodii TaxID=6455 RepID=UPI0039EA3D69